LLVFSCKTVEYIYLDPPPPYIPPMPVNVVADDDPYVNEFQYALQVVRWKRLYWSIENILKITTDEEYNLNLEKADNVMTQIDQAFKEYEDSVSN